ncbi:MAG: GNAT family N-acetyltransferase [Verrucomicrobiales bacterium]|nr:GNAT family N-acetyltransferase [Verrucomicrobiales bacterium]
MMNIPWQKILPNGGRLFLGGGASVPYGLVDQLLKKADSFQDVEWMHIHTLGELPWLEPRYRGHFRTNTFFLTRTMWEAVNEGYADYTPCPMSDIPRLFDKGVIKLDVALIQVSPPDANGMVSLGVSADVLCSAIRNARTVVAQINKHIPTTFGDSVIPMDAIHYSVELDTPLMTMEPKLHSERHRKIAEYAAQLIDNGSTIQASLGDCPQTVLEALKHGHRDLGIHTGCFTDAMMDLVKSGVVTNRKKEYQNGVTVATHCLGTQELYDFVDGNREIEMHSSEWANAPHRIGKHPNMVAINGAREVDLTGQVVRDSRGHRFYGGIGATQDFIRGAAGSKAGRPIIVLTATRNGGRASRIVPGLSAGSGVCTSRGDVHYVVTEFGVANLVGQSIRQRVLRLVEIAHPRFQEALLEGARGQGWIPKTFGATTGKSRADDDEIEIKKVNFSGIQYVVRPLHPSDMRSLQEFFYAQDEETIRLRYGYAMPKLDEQTAYRMSSVDQSKDLALGVFYRNHLREDLRAVGRFYVDSTETTAEIAFLVHERTRRKGIAQYLLREMAVIARERGIKQFWASVLKRNVPMARLFANFGARKENLPGEDSNEFWMDTEKLLDLKSDGLDPVLGIYLSENLLKHETGKDHPESAERYRAVLDALESIGNVKRIPDRKATVDEVLLVHTAHYHDLVRIDIEEFRDCLRTGDTAVCEDSYDVVMEALGGVLQAGDEVMSGSVNRAFCAVRPPGHHATADRGMGFCIFNHVAVLTRYLQKKHGVGRVAILDWDVHHGNGTQDIFYESPDVFYVSTHQEGIFPYTGLAEETGAGDGVGTTLNLPLPLGAGDVPFIEAWEKALVKVEAFSPECLIVSAGFDAAIEDPMADLQITMDGFATVSQMARDVADRVCEGRLISLLEGGYDPSALAASVVAHVEVLASTKKST